MLTLPGSSLQQHTSGCTWMSSGHKWMLGCNKGLALSQEDLQCIKPTTQQKHQAQDMFLNFMLCNNCQEETQLKPSVHSSPIHIQVLHSRQVNKDQEPISQEQRKCVLQISRFCVTVYSAHHFSLINLQGIPA